MGSCLGPFYIHQKLSKIGKQRQMVQKSPGKVSRNSVCSVSWWISEKQNFFGNFGNCCFIHYWKLPTIIETRHWMNGKRRWFIKCAGTYGTSTLILGFQPRVKSVHVGGHCNRICSKRIFYENRVYFRGRISSVGRGETWLPSGRSQVRFPGPDH